MTIQERMKEIKMRVDESLAHHLDAAIAEAKEEDALMEEVLTYMKKIILAGGKRIRPAMTIYGHIAAGGKINDDIIQASAGVELVHVFLLMHDDIIDRDDLRHGEQTMHARFRDRAGILFDRGDSAHFGVSTAIIMGDYCYALGNKLIFTTTFPAQAIVGALAKLQEVVKRTGIGEFQDVVIGYARGVDEKHVLKMYENKTARYTFEGPAQLGATLAGADEEFCKKLSGFTIPLGIAFQIQDDILGIYGSSEKTGKPVGTDIAEGKMTLLVIRALGQASKEQKQRITLLLGKQDITEQEKDEFQQLLDATGALTAVKDDMRKYIDTARAELAEAKLGGEAEEFFGDLITYLEKRDV